MQITPQIVVDALGDRQSAARMLGITPDAITKWLRNGVPPKHWPEIVAHTGLTYQQLEQVRPQRRKHPAE